MRTGWPIWQIAIIATDLLERLLKFDPSQRLSCEDALNHQYFQSDSRIAAQQNVAQAQQRQQQHDQQAMAQQQFQQAQQHQYMQAQIQAQQYAAQMAVQQGTGGASYTYQWRSLLTCLVTESDMLWLSCLFGCL